MRTAQDEMARVGEYDYVVVNRDGGVREAARAISSIIVAERLRAFPRQIRI